MRGHFRAYTLFCREIVFIAIYAFLRKYWGLKLRSRNFFDKYDVCKDLDLFGLFRICWYSDSYTSSVCTCGVLSISTHSCSHTCGIFTRKFKIQTHHFLPPDSAGPDGAPSTVTQLLESWRISAPPHLLPCLPTHPIQTIFDISALI